MKKVLEGTTSAPITLYDFEPTPDRFCDDVVSGLTRAPKCLPPKYFYDQRGAELFEKIMELDAYYPTRTEISILRQHAGEIAARLGRDVRLVEFGSGSGEKTWILLRHLDEPAAYLPVDISRAQLIEFAMRVNQVFPDLTVVPICADYTGDFALPLPDTPVRRSVAFFPGSTIGNFEPPQAQRFLTSAKRLVGADGGMLLGMDLRKDPAIIEAAYNDPEGVTAQFNLNLLDRINRECGGSFERDSFHHHAFFDADKSRIEMRLVSEVDQTVAVCCEPGVAEPIRLEFRAGEHITTEYSHKYDLESFAELASGAGWAIEEVWMDPKEWFAVVLLK